MSVSQLTKKFADFTAVDDVSFSVPAGESLAIVGESGSGKTTIARMIVGLERPTSGTITACGHDRSRPARSARDRRRRGGEVQIVFQDPYTSLDPRQSAAGRDRRGAAPAPRLAARPPGGAGRRAGLAGRPGRAPGAGAAAGAVGRATAAGGDRPRARGRAPGAAARRVGRGPRRVHPGAGAEPAGRHPRLDRRLLHPDQPRPGRRAPAGRARDRVVARPGGGAGPDGRDPRRSAARVHPAAARQRPPPGLSVSGCQRGGRPQGRLLWL